MLSLLKATNLSKRNEKSQRSRPIDLELEEGEICGIIGPSGAGKSTLLKCLNLLLLPSTGVIEFREKVIWNSTSSSWWEQRKMRQQAQMLRKKMVTVFQDPGVFSHITVLENVSYPPAIPARKI